MKTLVLVRHAKSDWGDPGLADHDRPLNDRGRRDAPAMAERLGRLGTVPGLIVSSTALRARTTAEAMAEGLGLDPSALRLDERLYGAGPATILEIAGQTPDDVDTVMLVAHDPGMTDLAYRLSDGTVDRMPTCAVVRVRIAAESWRDLENAVIVDVHRETPR
ncbi:SixA phosphatase family protein [Agromyces marinus]|uniref:Phosphohistidine phosphatase SixA n=1 Tax=Agromyces marinus TaxID=1389020 RepID=A0ABM8H300_9MICO|nr:histidine phosphatase family protein [Agromyces marinus]UIP59754.1 putative protein [Agromyces marinus]BDZ55167.1 phosphohistidine phosphatase SixA [Agromyces marinus]